MLLQQQQQQQLLQQQQQQQQVNIIHTYFGTFYNEKITQLIYVILSFQQQQQQQQDVGLARLGALGALAGKNY